MRVLITGSKGQVGRSLVELLVDRDDIEFFAFDSKDLDITDFCAVYDTVKSLNPDYIINAAAYTAVDNAETEVEKAYSVNYNGVENLAKVANLFNAVILHISTDYVFDGSKKGLYDEEDIAKPITVYGKSKRDGELAVKKLAKKHIILRTAWVFSEHGRNFVNTMLSIGRSNRDIAVVSDQFGGPTYSGDIAKALINIICQISKVEHDDLESCYGTYHYSGYPHLSWFEFANYIFLKASKYNLLIPPVISAIDSNQYLTKAKRPSNSKLCCGKINKIFSIIESDWKASVDDILRAKNN